MTDLLNFGKNFDMPSRSTRSDRAAVFNAKLKSRFINIPDGFLRENLSGMRQ